MKNIILVLVYLILSTVSVILIKDYSANINNIKSFFSLKIIIPAIFYGLSFLTWLFILKNNNLSSIYPVTISLSIIAVTTCSVFFLKENVNYPYFISGLFFVLTGIFLILK